jgi:hypothetical protein
MVSPEEAFCGCFVPQALCHINQSRVLVPNRTDPSDLIPTTSVYMKVEQQQQSAIAVMEKKMTVFVSDTTTNFLFCLLPRLLAHSVSLSTIPTSRK